MRSLLIWLGILLLAGASLIEVIESDPGYVLISIWQTRIELSFWLALSILILIFALAATLLKLVRVSLQSTHSILGRVLGGNPQRAARRTSQGLLDFLEGNWKQSRKNLLKSVKKSQMPLVSYLAAARSSYELGDQEEALALLHKAEKSAPNSELAVALTQARMQLRDKKYEQCLGTLARARRVSPAHPVVIDLLHQVYETVQDWKSLLGLLPDLKKHKILKAEDLYLLEKNIHSALLKEADSLNAVHNHWKTVPSAQKKGSELIASYVQRLQTLGAEDESEVILRSALGKYWDDSLLRLYGLVEGKDKARQLLCAEGWLKERPSNALLMLTLGRLCMRNELWGRAREYFQSSLQLQKDPNAYAELARLLAHLGEHEKSTEYYQQGLLMTAQDLQDLPLPSAG